MHLFPPKKKRKPPPQNLHAPLAPLHHLHLHHGALIMLPRDDHIIRRTHQHDGPQDQTTVIHIQGRDCARGGPETKEADHHQIDRREDVVGDAEPGVQPPGAPDEVDAGHGHGPAVAVVVFGSRLANVPFEAAVEEEGDGDEVGDVEGFEGEGEQVLEGGGGADVDETEEGAGDDGGGYGAHGDAGAAVDLGGFFLLGWFKEGEVGGMEQRRTWTSQRHAGRASSRANDHISRLDEARQPAAEQAFMTMMMLMSTVEAALLLSAVAKMLMMG